MLNRTRTRTQFTSEFFRMYKVFPAREDGTDTLTIVLSIENQAYSTWTRAGQPSEAPLLTMINSARWNLECSMNIGEDGHYLSPEAFKAKLDKIGYKRVKIGNKERLAGLKKPLPGFSNKLPKKKQHSEPKPYEPNVLDPDDWTTLRMKDKIKKIFGEGK